jgi:hypothetical protein
MDASTQKTARACSNVFGFILSLFFSAALVAAGLAMIYLLTPRTVADVQTIEQAYVTDGAAYEALAPGQDVVVTGTPEGNAAVGPDNMVAYFVDRLEAKRMSDETDWIWVREAEEIPPITMRVGWGTVTLVSMAEGYARVGGDLYETVEQGGGSRRFTYVYKGQSLREGARRTTGLRNGDLVTVVGKKTATGEIEGRWYFGGDQTALHKSAAKSALIVRIIGHVLVIIGASMGVWTLIGLFRR